jgi:hypothetical protein
MGVITETYKLILTTFGPSSQRYHWAYETTESRPHLSPNVQIFETQCAENQLLKVCSQALEWMEIAVVWILHERRKNWNPYNEYDCNDNNHWRWVYNILFYFSYLRRNNNNHSHNFINVYYICNDIIMKYSEDQEKKKIPFRVLIWFKKIC